MYPFFRDDSYCFLKKCIERSDIAIAVTVSYRSAVGEMWMYERVMGAFFVRKFFDLFMYYINLLSFEHKYLL
jgi:hypothetical protein